MIRNVLARTALTARAAAATGARRGRVVAAVLVVPVVAAAVPAVAATTAASTAATASTASTGTSAAVAPASVALAARAPTDRPDTLAAARRAPASARNAWVGDLLPAAGDKDWFRYVVPRGTWTKLTLGALPADYRLSLYDSAGRRLAVSDRTGRVYEEISRGLGAGTYFVLVDSTRARDARRPYQLQLRSFAPGLSVQSLRRVPAEVTLVGELFNNTANWRAVGTMRLSYVDRRGRVLGTSPHPLMPGQKVAPRETVSFTLAFPPEDVPRGTTGFRVTPMHAVARPDPDYRLSVRVTGRTTQVGGRTYRYTVTNAGRRSQWVNVSAREYDDLGVLTRLGYEAVQVAAGRSAAFWVSAWPLLAQPTRSVVSVRRVYELD